MKSTLIIKLMSSSYKHDLDFPMTVFLIVTHFTFTVSETFKRSITLS